MKDLTFIQQLKAELPVWIKNGWINSETEAHILEYLGENHKASHPPINTITFTLAWMGVILLTGGLVTFFAHQWAIFSNVTKVGILFGNLWVALLLSYFFRKQTARLDFNKKMSEFFLFLGILIYGTNIWLISYIYHIDEHYPTGVLLWSLGALFAAYLMRSPVALILSIFLGTLWSAMETFDFMRSVHLGFPVLWVFFVIPCVRNQWGKMLHLACLSLFLWSIFIIILYVADFFFMQVYFLMGLATFLLGKILATYPKLQFKNLAPTIQHYGAGAALLGLFIPTFPLNITKERGLFFDIIPAVGGLETLYAILLVLGMMYWLSKRAKQSFDQTSLISGYGIFLTLCLLMGINLLLGSHIESHRVFIAITFNFFFLTALGWIIYTGYQSRDQILINLGFAFFALLVLSRFMDTFWTYFNRSFFYISGGLILTLGSYYFERQRRKITAKIEEASLGRRQ